MTKGEKVKEFIGQHKDAIAGIGSAVAGIARLMLMTRGMTKAVGCDVPPGSNFKVNDITPANKLAVGEMLDFWQECPNFKNMIVNKLTMADIGKLGESIVKDCGVETITMETPIALVLDIFDAGMVVEGMRLKPLGKIMETITNVGLYNMTMRLQVGREALVRISWAQ